MSSYLDNINLSSLWTASSIALEFLDNDNRVTRNRLRYAEKKAKAASKTNGGDEK